VLWQQNVKGGKTIKEIYDISIMTGSMGETMKRIQYYVLIVICTLSPQVYGQIDGRNENPPFEIPPGVHLEQNIPFCQIDEKSLTLDLYLPGDPSVNRPAIIFVHGGGWRSGNKYQFRRQAAYFASKGYVCICIEYRLSGEAVFPAAVEDCKCAVRWLRARAEMYDIDPGKIAAAGGSAGGHLASLLGVLDGHSSYEGSGGYADFSSKVNAVISLNGVAYLPIDVPGERIPALVIQFIGGTWQDHPELYRQASPITHIDAADSPFLFIHGTGDTTVPHKQSVDFTDALKLAGVPAEIYSVEGQPHGFFNRPPWYEPALKRMGKFLDIYLE
jgi:acetyl esterase/lipase